MPIAPSLSFSWKLSKLGFYLSTETERGSPILADDYVSKKLLSDPRERHFGIIRDMGQSQRDRRKIQNCRLFLVNTLGSGSQGPIVRCWIEQIIILLAVSSSLRQVL